MAQIMGNHEITLNAYCKLERKKIDNFYKYWMAHSKLDPENWPLKMPLGEWFEQYIIADGEL